MKLYWPMAKFKTHMNDVEQLHTYDSYMSLEECKKAFHCWEDDYAYDLIEMWVDVTDPEDESYHCRYDVHRDYIFMCEVK